MLTITYALFSCFLGIIGKVRKRSIKALCHVSLAI